MSVISAASSCPLCGEPNQCAMATAGADAAPCWCEQHSFSEALLTAVPPSAKGRFCICQRCVNQRGAVNEVSGQLPLRQSEV
ncbi:MAG TPA: cysteine-rich CWC family protein [Burkholderiaceae bacterium]|nr:cysteine-rich CWC family protein [Burkholderiaceae bacterium]